ncbi:MAG: MBOAT family O-acyltransferase [Acholeplasma sp.]|nr:MBOAT family O-acyltransferase [Acholeplasma sp.]
MLFNSFSFLIFFPSVCILYFILPYKYRWVFLLLASYYFYMNWKPIYALLIFGSTLVTYLSSLLIDKFREQKPKKRLFLVLSLILNFGVLFIYKYYNFINESVYQLFDYLNISYKVPNLDVLLPVGISFYTFQAVGYTIDVYRGDIKPERNLGIYALFVSFFPQLVAGPIERAKSLLPQFRQKFDFDAIRIAAGLKQMLWGFFMKVVVADRVSIYVNAIYNNVDHHNGTTLLLATFLFSVQIYCDFAGYSNIAIGAAKIMGFTLMENFRRPYFAKSISEFWKRWHISLSTWFRDYVYIPLGGNRVSPNRHLVNLFITFLMSGIWHGANWTFLIWGALHGFYLIIGVLKHRYFKDDSSSYVSILITLLLVMFGWVFFRANNITDAILVINKIFASQGKLFVDQSTLVYSLFGIALLFLKEIKDEYHLNFHFSSSKKMVIRYIYYVTMISIIILFGVFDGSQFIYFQF